MSSNNRRKRLIVGSEPVTTFENREMANSLVDRLSEWLLHVPLMHDLSQKVRNKIARRMQIGKVDSGAEVVHVGEPGDVRVVTLLIHALVTEGPD